MKKEFVLFVDIDSTLNSVRTKWAPHPDPKRNTDWLGMDSRNVRHLHMLLLRLQWSHPGYKRKVVFHTAWNLNTLDFMRETIASAGLGLDLVDEWDQCVGGGGTCDHVFTYLRGKGRHGVVPLNNSPYVIIDDCTRDARLLWGRIAPCKADGFDHELADLAYSILTRPVTAQSEMAAIALGLANDSLYRARHRAVELEAYILEVAQMRAVLADAHKCLHRGSLLRHLHLTEQEKEAISG